MTPTATRFDAVVVGGGIAGVVAATRAAELGLRVAVLETGEEASYLCNAPLSVGAATDVLRAHGIGKSGRHGASAATFDEVMRAVEETRRRAPSSKRRRRTCSPRRRRSRTSGRERPRRRRGVRPLRASGWPQGRRASAIARRRAHRQIQPFYGRLEGMSHE